MAVQDIKTYAFKNIFSLSTVLFEKACVVNKPEELESYGIFWIKKGKAFNIYFEHDFINNQLAEFIRHEVLNSAVQGNQSFYSAIMELKLKDGSNMLSEEAVATEWKDGQIFRERYYHS